MPVKQCVKDVRESTQEDDCEAAWEDPRAVFMLAAFCVSVLQKIAGGELVIAFCFSYLGKTMDQDLSIVFCTLYLQKLWVEV